MPYLFVPFYGLTEKNFSSFQNGPRIRARILLEVYIIQFLHSVLDSSIISRIRLLESRYVVHLAISLYFYLRAMESLAGSLAPR